MSVIISHNGGFFSCCSVKLHYIIEYMNEKLKIPDYVDSSAQFDLYKKSQNDITYEYFQHYDNIKEEININFSIKYEWENQFIDYSKVDYNNVIPVVKKYFSPSNQIINIVDNLKQKYHINYDNVCVLFYRGNDKITETKLCNYDEYLVYANLILKKNPNIVFLIQSDETEFINFMIEKFPQNSFYFKDEIRHVNKCNSTVDILMRDKNYEFSKYYLSITIIMSKCKYIVCGSGNCSIWIMLYRGNNNNVYQNLNGIWNSNHINSDWKFISDECEVVTNISVGSHIRYGEGVNWIEDYNKTESFEVSNIHFNGDPSPGIKKQLQICTKCLI